MILNSSILLCITFLSSTHSANPTKEYSSYRRYPLCQPSDDIRYPTSVADVVKIVKEAVGRKLTVKAFGVRHSQTDIICTEGIPVDMTGLQSMKMNDDNTATFGAGLNLREATTFLRSNDRGLRTTPAFGNITIGGAIGTGAHGSTIKYNSSISSQVAKLKIVDGSGDIKEITDPEDLKAFKMHLGLLGKCVPQMRNNYYLLVLDNDSINVLLLGRMEALAFGSGYKLPTRQNKNLEAGIVVEVTLNTVELYKTVAHNYVVPDEILTNGNAVAMAKNTDQIALYWFPEFKEVVVANWTIVDKATVGTDYTNDHTPSMYNNFALISSLAKEIAFGLTESRCAAANTLGYTVLRVIEFFLELVLLIPLPDYVPIYATQKGVFQNPAVGYYDEMFAPICFDDPQGILGAACAWSHGVNGISILDNEFGLELSRLSEFIKAVKAIIRKTPTAFPLQGILMRFSEKSDIYMSTAYGRQTVHFEFYLWNRKNRYDQASGSLAGYQTILQTLTNEFNARSHWGKSGLVYHNSRSIDMKLDKTARRNFVAVMKKYDPNETFINNFGRRLKGTGTEVDIDPLTKHCALLDNCICSKNSDCALTQICTTLPGYSYRVCKTKNEIPEVVFDKSLLPPPLGVVSYLVSVVPTLVTAVISNCSLTDAVGTVGSLLRVLTPIESIENVLQTVGTLGKQLGKLKSLADVIGVVDDILVGVLSG